MTPVDCLRDTGHPDIEWRLLVAAGEMHFAINPGEIEGVELRPFAFTLADAPPADAQPGQVVKVSPVGLGRSIEIVYILSRCGIIVVDSSILMVATAACRELLSDDLAEGVLFAVGHDVLQLALVRKRSIKVDRTSLKRMEVLASAFAACNG